jgi:hypothetical protein
LFNSFTNSAFSFIIVALAIRPHINEFLDSQGSILRLRLLWTIEKQAHLSPRAPVKI